MENKRLEKSIDSAIAEAIEGIRDSGGSNFNGERTYNGYGTCNAICRIVSAGKSAMLHNYPHNAVNHFLAAAILSKYGDPLNCSEDAKSEICERLNEAVKLAKDHTDSTIWSKAIQGGLTPMRADGPFQKLVITHHDGTESHHNWQEVLDWVRKNKPRELEPGFTVADCFIKHKLNCDNGAREYTLTA